MQHPQHEEFRQRHLDCTDPVAPIGQIGEGTGNAVQLDAWIRHWDGICIDHLCVKLERRVAQPAALVSTKTGVQNLGFRGGGVPPATAAPMSGDIR